MSANLFFASLRLSLKVGVRRPWPQASTRGLGVSCRRFVAQGVRVALQRRAAKATGRGSRGSTWRLPVCECLLHRSRGGGGEVRTLSGVQGSGSRPMRRGTSKPAS
eukprot:scaffold301221_cov28-Tisochrysis_lutea.AAC.1